MGVKNGDVPPHLKEEQEDETYMSNNCGTSLHSEENLCSQVISSLQSEIPFMTKIRPA